MFKSVQVLNIEQISHILTHEYTYSHMTDVMWTQSGFSVFTWYCKNSVNEHIKVDKLQIYYFHYLSLF